MTSALTVLFVGHVSTIIVSVTDPWFRDTAKTASTLERVRRACDFS